MQNDVATAVRGGPPADVRAREEGVEPIRPVAVVVARQHRRPEGLAEAAGAAQEGVAFLLERVEEARLVDVQTAFAADRLEVGPAVGDGGERSGHGVPIIARSADGIKRGPRRARSTRGCGESDCVRSMAVTADHAVGPTPHGSIPAGAGNPRTAGASRGSRRVHPRGCGESEPVLVWTALGQGPSPRVRGILAAQLLSGAVAGSIPAGAGNPRIASSAAPSSQVHPRGCGESRLLSRVGGPELGPSPRVRGIPPAEVPHPAARGSIPAGAGNPTLRGGRPLRREVHPRGCGESVTGLAAGDVVYGPSPRVRGIRRAGAEGRRGRGSIPAGAGNPRTSGRPAARRRVHPRGCGESSTR